MKLKVLFISVVFFGLLACNNDDDTGSKICDNSTLISPEAYANETTAAFNINSMEIQDSCLKISISSSGCGGNSWELKLIDSGDVLESMPPQRNLRLSLKNNEICLAIVTKEVTFDISNLKVDGGQVQLNIVNSDAKILYKY